MFFIISLSNPIWHIYFLSFVWLHPFIMLNMLLNLRRLWWCYKIGFCQEIKKVAKSLLNTNAQYIYMIHLVASNNVRPKILYFWARRNVIKETRDFHWLFFSLAFLVISIMIYGIIQEYCIFIRKCIRKIRILAHFTIIIVKTLKIHISTKNRSAKYG